MSEIQCAVTILSDRHYLKWMVTMTGKMLDV